MITSRALIDIQQGELKHRIDKDEVTFNESKVLIHPKENNECLIIDIDNLNITKNVKDNLKNPLEPALLESITENRNKEHGSKLEKHAKLLDGLPSIPPRK